MEKYFIYDCNNVGVGNPRGYRTFTGAERQASGKTKLRDQLWETFYKRENKENNLVSCIRLVSCDTITLKQKAIAAPALMD